MKPLYIFDLDGTLALNEHRQHLAKAQKWDEFFEACHLDKPNYPVIRTMTMLAGCDILIFSGRSDQVRHETEKWLCDYTPYDIGDRVVLFDRTVNMLRMRRAGDYTPDEGLKRQWYLDLPLPDRERLVAVFDDRDKVVSMWRELGVACFQVAPGLSDGLARK